MSTHSLPISTSLLLGLFWSGCGSPTSGGDAAAGGGPAGATLTWPVPRRSVNHRAVYAPEELQPLAAELLGQLLRLGLDRSPRVAFYYFTRDGRKDFLGESIAQDLATLMVRGAQGRVEVYTRRKLETVARELKTQLTDLFDQDTLARLGKLAGVEIIVSGRLVFQPDALVINSQLLDVRTGAIVGGHTARVSLADARVSEPVLELEPLTKLASDELCRSLPEAGEWRLAIYDLERSKEDFALGREVAEAIGTELGSRCKHVRPLTRSALSQAMKELEVQRSDLFDESTLVRIAQFVGGNVILTGFAEIFRDFYLLNLQVVEVESARILAGRLCLLRRRPGS